MKFPIQTVIEFLNEGNPCLVDDLQLYVNDIGDLEVVGWSNFSNPKFLPKAIAITELEEIKELFVKMCDTFPELVKFASNKSKVYTLCFDCSGKTSVEICQEKNGIVRWSFELE